MDANRKGRGELAREKQIDKLNKRGYAILFVYPFSNSTHNSSPARTKAALLNEGIKTVAITTEMSTVLYAPAWVRALWLLEGTHLWRNGEIGSIHRDRIQRCLKSSKERVMVCAEALLNGNTEVTKEKMKRAITFYMEECDDQE